MSKLQANIATDTRPAEQAAPACDARTDTGETSRDEFEREREKIALELESFLLTVDARTGLALAAASIETFLRRKNELRIADALKAIISQ